MNQFTSRMTLRVCAARRVLSIALLTSLALLPRMAEAQTLPSGWTATDVGNPSIAGKATYSAGTFTLEGVGNSTYYEVNNQFFYVHQQVTGDATIITKVGYIENTNVWAKAGIMIRESLASDSRHAFVFVTPKQGIAFQRRLATAGTTAHTSATGAAPVWLKLQRQGSKITASKSTTGTTWTTIGSATISMSSTVHIGLVVSSYNAAALATGTFSNVSVSGSSAAPSPTPPPPTSTLLPTGWTGADVGSPAVAGLSAYANGAFTVSGAGADVWGTSDQFQFAYRQVSGDVDVIARVASFQGPHEWSKAGVMVRASMAANAPHAFMLTSVANGLAFQRRPAAGYSSVGTSAGAGTAPVWVKLERRGSAITGFRSPDGVNWTMVGSQTLTLPSTFYVGLAVTSHSTSARATAQFTGVNVVTATSTANAPPTVSLTSPTSGATYTAPASVAIAANAADADNGVAQVDFYANGALIGTDATSPYGYTWSGVAAGSYTLTAVVRDKAGATATSAARSITVKTSSGSTNVPPTVSLTAPTSGASYVAPASVTISANAADSNGTIARVDFYAGATLVGSDTTSPYSVTWLNAPAGLFSLTAVARDNVGAATTSGARSITINSPTLPKRAVFTPSADHATVTRYVLDIFTAGANPGTTAAVATRDLGKPAVVNGQCDVDISTTIVSLPGGNYFATVVAVSSGGTSTRAVSSTFAR